MAAVEFRSVSKKFLLRPQGQRSFQETVVGLLGGNHSRREFWALRDVSFSIPEGQALGIIGENGSGKSTTLRLINRVLQPTKGAIVVNGQVSALLELAAGFHPDLTGRENIFLNGSLLGFSRAEFKEKLPRIIDFCELGDFIDIQIKYYSSGMLMRLGFAIAISVSPDILLIDEVISVGDEAFQQKSFQEIMRFREEGRTIVFVSHDLATMERICDRALLLDEGRVVGDGTPRAVISDYRALLATRERPPIAIPAFPK